MLKIENLSAFYGKKQVIFDLSAEFKSGRFTAILGRNGSGKSSLLSCIGGIKECSGKILLGYIFPSSVDRHKYSSMCTKFSNKENSTKS